MADLEELYKSRISARIAREQRMRDIALAQKEKDVEIAQKFFDKISFLNNYGFNWELFTMYDSDCNYWRVFLINRNCRTSPFEDIIVAEINGEIKGKFSPTILGKGRHIEGQDGNGWFTPEQLVMAFS